MPTPNLDPEIRALLTEAQQHEQGGRAEAARQAYRQIVETQPQCGEAWLGLCTSLAHDDLWPETLTSCQQALQAMSDVRADGYDVDLGTLGLLHSLSANAYKQAGQPEEAILEYKLAIYYLPRHARAHYELGISCWEEGRLPEATRYLARALELDYNAADNLHAFQNALTRYKAQEAQKLPVHIRESVDKGLSLYRKQNFAEAQTHFQTVLKTNPDHAQAWCYLGLCQLAQHDPSGQGNLERAARIAADDAEVLKHLAWHYANNSQLEKAIATYLHALQVQPNYVPAYVELGALYQQQGRWGPALEVLKRARYFDREGAFDPRAMLAFCQAWVQAKPPLARAHYELALRYLVVEDWPAAITELTAALQYGHEHPDTYVYFSLALIETQDWNRAIQSLKTATSQQPERCILHMMFAYAYFNGVKDNKRALAACKTALSCLEQQANSPTSAAHRRLVRQMNNKIEYPSRDDQAFWLSVRRHIRAEVIHGI